MRTSMYDVISNTSHKHHFNTIGSEYDVLKFIQVSFRITDTAVPLSFVFGSISSMDMQQALYGPLGLWRRKPEAGVIHFEGPTI